VFLAPLLLLGQADSAGPDRFSLKAGTGSYEVTSPTLGWKLSGSVGAPLRDIRTDKGTDKNGDYTETRFEWNAGTPVRAEVRCYQGRDAVRFRLHYLARSPKPVVFPNFTAFPSELKTYSFQDKTFSPPSYSLNQTSTPWLFFNGRAQAMILSPASNFMIAKMVGDGSTSIGSSLNDRLKEVPKDLDQDSLMVFGQGICNTWDAWGGAIRNLYDRPAADPDKDILLREFGYWTDNGADYYYNYDTGKGYAATLQAVVDRYRAEGIPLGYMQLDSWWYQKSIDDPSGKPGGATKNAKLPAETWNRYGGTMVYRASPDLFPTGLAAFQNSVGLPLATHGRWIDRKTPDHDRFKFSGVASIDPRWWNDTADYLAYSGVVCYEQDWLDRIYANSPDMSSVSGVADAFTDDMAKACAVHGLSMQYCMASPRFFLQGTKYPNLSTIRTSDDRFDRRKWPSFLYVSQLAECIGAYPWCDVFKSTETANMILAVLSAGPVGTGDALGKEDKGNILRAVRPDGIIVKPDRPLVPCDQTYIYASDPFLASTYTDQDGFKTRYFFAFPREENDRTVRILPRRLGIDRTSYLLDLTPAGEGSGNSKLIEPDQEVDLPIGDAGYIYFMIAPTTDSELALFGDLDMFMPTGKQRISAISEEDGGLRVGVEFAAGEGPVTLQGFSPKQPRVTARQGKALMHFDASRQRFTVDVTPAGKHAEILINKNP